MAAGFALIALAAFAYREVDAWSTSRALVAASPDQIPDNPGLAEFGLALAKPAYAQRCAGCHGVDMKGDRAKGAPNLVDAVWLFENGHVSEIERTILYGVRSGLGKARNLTDMPGLGVDKRLTPDDIRDVEALIFSLGRQNEDPEAVRRGARIFANKGNCYDCHGGDARGVSEYGAPNLIDAEWIYGGDPEAVYDSIYYGRHGICPAWIGKLSFATVRGLAVYIYEMSHPKSDTPSSKSVSAAGRAG